MNRKTGILLTFFVSLLIPLTVIGNSVFNYYYTNYRFPEVREQFYNLAGSEVDLSYIYAVNGTQTVYLNTTAEGNWSAFKITTWSDYGCNLSITVTDPDNIFESFNVTLLQNNTALITGDLEKWDEVPLRTNDNSLNIWQINATEAGQQTAYLFVGKAPAESQTGYFRFRADYKAKDSSETPIVIRVTYSVVLWEE